MLSTTRAIMGSVALLTLLLSRPVVAQPTGRNDLQAGFTAFLDSITDDPKTAHLNGTQLLILPDANGIVTSPSGLAVKDLLGVAGPVTWKVHFDRAKLSTTFSKTTGSVAADVDAFDRSKKKLATLRVSAELFRNDPKSPWTIIAAHFGAPLGDDAAAARALDN